MLEVIMSSNENLKTTLTISILHFKYQFRILNCFEDIITTISSSDSLKISFKKETFFLHLDDFSESTTSVVESSLLELYNSQDDQHFLYTIYR